MSLTDNNIRLTQAPGSTRPAAVAGSFYPDDPVELEDTVRGLLAAQNATGPVPKAIIAPHAGYIYSGKTAARAYAVLAAVRDRIKRVVLLGPAHRVAVRGIACSGHNSFATPLGEIPLDMDCLRRIRTLEQVSVLEAAHEQEHSLEVQLPFLQLCLARFTLVPLVVGDASADEVREVLELLWGGEETLIVISSDLSHFHDYTTASRIDTATSAAIRRKELEKIGPHEACGCIPLRGLLALARQQDCEIEVLETINSGDTAGSRDRVVGYGAYWLFEKLRYTPVQRNYLLDLARETISAGLRGGPRPVPDLAGCDPVLAETRATFVTLQLDGKLRGCIGTTEAQQPLAASVADSAWKAAFQDPRFPPVTAAEFDHITVAISVLSPAQEITFKDEADLLQKLVPGRDGLIIQASANRATFLPSVWETIADAGAFLRHLKQKAGLPDGDRVEQAWTYRTEGFGKGPET